MLFQFPPIIFTRSVGYKRSGLTTKYLPVFYSLFIDTTFDLNHTNTDAATLSKFNVYKFTTLLYNDRFMMILKNQGSAG